MRAVESFVPDVEGRREASVKLLEQLQMAAFAAGLRAEFFAATNDRNARLEIVHPRPRRYYGVLTWFEEDGMIYLEGLGGANKSMYAADCTIWYDAVTKSWRAPGESAVVRMSRWVGGVLRERSQPAR